MALAEPRAVADPVEVDRTPGAMNQHATIVTNWWDNQSGSRPAAADLAGGYQLKFTVDGNTYSLHQRDGTLTDEAKSLLGLSDDFNPDVQVFLDRHRHVHGHLAQPTRHGDGALPAAGRHRR